MKKSKLLGAVAMMLVSSMLFAGCSKSEETKKKSKKDKDDKETEETEDDETEETEEDETKKTKEETTTEEETTTTEEETTTTAADTSAAATTPAADTSAADTTPAATGSMVVPDGMESHKINDLEYAVTTDWTFVEQGSYQYFFVDQGDSSRFLMVYGMQALSAAQANLMNVEEFVDQFNEQITTDSTFKNGSVVSCDKHLDSDLPYADMVYDCEVNGKASTLPTRIYIDKSTGYCYVFMFLVNKDTDDATLNELMTKYNDMLATITKVS